MSRPTARSFTGVLPEIQVEGSILETDQFDMVRRRKTNEDDLPFRPMMRKFSLMPLSSGHFFERSGIKRTLVSLRRSNSLPDRKTLQKLESDISFTSQSNANRKLSKTRSVSFHPEILSVNAAADNDVDELQALFERNLISSEFKNDRGQTLLHTASLSGSYEAMQYLIEMEVDVNMLDASGQSPLDYAIRAGFFDCACLLISSGAKVERVVDGFNND